MSGRNDQRYYAADLISDILSRGTSSRLYRRLVKEHALFSEVNAYVLGSLDPGLFVVEGKLSQGVSMEAAEAAIDEEVERLVAGVVPGQGFTQVNNKVKQPLLFSVMNLLDKTKI